MKRKKWDSPWLGLLAGVVFAVIGFLLFAIGFSLYNEISITHFIKNVFLGVQDFQSRIVTISMLPDVILFFVMMRRNYYNFCKGLLAIMVMSVAVVAMLY